MQALLIGLALAVSTHAKAAEILELSAIEARVHASNPVVAAAWAEARQADAHAVATSAWPDPGLSYEWMQMPSGLNPAEATRHRIQLSQTLPFPGKTWARSREADHAVRRAVAAARVIEARLLYEAKAAYWDLQEATRLAEAQKTAQAAFDSMRQVSAQRNRFGRLDRMGQLMDAMLEREAASSESLGLEWQARGSDASLRLQRLLGVDPSAGAISVDSADLEALLALEARGPELLKHRSMNPEWQEALHHVDHAKAGRRAAQADWLPDLVLQGGVAQGGGPDESNLMVGMSLPWLWFWGQSGKAKAANLEVTHAEAMAQEAERMATELALGLANDLQSEQARLRLSTERIMPAAKRALSAARAGYASGDIAASDAMYAVMAYWQSEVDAARLMKNIGQSFAAIQRLLAAPMPENSHD